jgi:ribosomal protein S18 acetylase RimI-like enzyme
MRRFIIRARTRLGHMSGYFHVGDLLWRMFSNGWVQPKKDIRLWFDGPDHLAGFAWYYSKFHAVDLQVFPRNPDLEQEMLIWAETNALSSSNGNGRKHLFTTALETDSDRIALLTEFGYKKQKAFYYHFLRALPSYLPVPELPPGFTIRDVTDKDIAAKVAVHRAAFHPSQMTEHIYAGLRQAPGYIPELDLVVVGPDGRLAAFCVCWMDPVNRIGEFEPVGTHPDFRRQGLAKAVVGAGMQRMKAFGADQAFVLTQSHNRAAEALCESLGVRAVNREFDYVKQF